MAAHRGADIAALGALARPRAPDGPVVEHCHPVGQLQDLVQILGNENDPGTGLAQIEQAKDVLLPAPEAASQP